MSRSSATQRNRNQPTIWIDIVPLQHLTRPLDTKTPTNTKDMSLIWSTMNIRVLVPKDENRALVPITLTPEAHLQTRLFLYFSVPRSFSQKQTDSSEWKFRPRLLCASLYISKLLEIRISDRTSSPVLGCRTSVTYHRKVDSSGRPRRCCKT